jgi:L-ascorbate metabolism protein UlaG (beta-lactamase superfamily)
MRAKYALLLIGIFIITSCVSVENRKESNFMEYSITLKNGTKLTSWESTDNYWHPSSFRIEGQGLVIYIDPINIHEPIPADYIFISHSHTDHLSIKDIKKINKPTTKIIVPQKVRINEAGLNIININPGDTIKLGSIECEAIPAYNFIHQKALKFVGYVLTLDMLRFYHAGDTGLIKEIKGIKNINVAMVPIGTGILAMNPKQAATAINQINPEIAIPMHYEIKSNKTKVFQQMVNSNIKVVIMENEAE